MTGFESLMAGLTTIYVVTTGYYAYVSHKTLDAIKKQGESAAEQLQLAKAQSDLMRSQTESAAKSAAAFINKERSRLFIHKEIANDFEATFYAGNRGQSPARITYGFVGCEIFDPEEDFAEIPDYTRGDPEWVFSQNEWLMPGKSEEIGGYDASYISKSENPELFEDVMNGKYIVWYYGIVRYMDSVSEDEHEIRFCYRCWPDKKGEHSLHEAGPAAYRRET